MQMESEIGVCGKYFTCYFHSYWKQPVTNFPLYQNYGTRQSCLLLCCWRFGQFVGEWNRRRRRREEMTSTWWRLAKKRACVDIWRHTTVYRSFQSSLLRTLTTECIFGDVGSSLMVLRWELRGLNLYGRQDEVLLFIITDKTRVKGEGRQKLSVLWKTKT